ncbi:MAG: hypothetical protein IPO78_11150 [Saprospiraceae bacterium]|nr:hypothetical protein [Saprospiraceae bacterium]
MTKINFGCTLSGYFSKGGDFMLKKGDKILVFSIRTSVEEQIFVTGKFGLKLLININPE